MALNFKSIKLDAINIDGKDYFPSTVTVERRMRVAKSSAGGEVTAEMLDNIAECFGDDKDELREKLNHLPVTAVFEIQLYIMNGEDAVQELREKQNKKDEEKDV